MNGHPVTRGHIDGTRPQPLLAWSSMAPADPPSRLRPDPGEYDADFWQRARGLSDGTGAAADSATAAPRRPADRTRTGHERSASPPPPDVGGPTPPASQHLPPAPPPPPDSRGGEAVRAGLPRRRRGGRRGLRLVGGLVVVLLVLALGAGLWTWRTWSSVERVDVGPVLADGGGDGTNYLLVGSDSRDGITADDPNAAALIGEEVTGRRSDTVMILRVTDTDARFLSLPRDLWLPIAGTGREQRLNSAYGVGPETLIRTVNESLGIPVHHYVEIDLATFADVVDAMGGVVIDFAHPAYDRASGLDVPTAGPVMLDGPQALAYVRSRQYTEIIDGDPSVDPTGDIGRGQRQQAFLRTVLEQASSTRNPRTAARLFGAVSGGVTVDDTLDLGAVIDLALSLRDSPPESTDLPVFNWTTSGGAAVLGLADGAEAVLAGFR